MNKSVVLGIGTILLLVAGCATFPEGTVERRFAMPDSLGSFVIRLDSNLTPLDSGVRHSDSQCDNQLYQQYTPRSWPDMIYPAFTSLDVSKDSLFRFTWSIDQYSSAECHSAQTVREWLKRELEVRRFECIACIPVDSGIVMVNGIPWAFVQYSDSLSSHNDSFQGYTVKSGRSVSLIWQRVAPSAIQFDFGAYARRQFATAKFD